MQSYTFLPKSGALYKGSIVEKNGEENFEQFIASFERSEANLSFMALGSKEDRDYVANSLRKTASSYKLKKVRPDLYKAQILKREIENLKIEAKGQGMYDASIQRKLLSKMEQYRAAINGDNTNQLTIVPFVNEIIGHLEQPSYLAASFKNIPLDKLRGKLPEMGWPDVQIQSKRLQEPEITATEFGQYEFRIFRNDIYLYIPREDRMEATIDPFAASMQQGNIQMMRARELLSLKAFSSLVNNGTYGTIPDMTATDTGSSVPRSKYDAAGAFVDVIVSHFTAKKNYLRTFSWNPIDYRVYLTNWYTKGYAEQMIPSGFGVIPFKGLENYGCTAIISPYVPRGFVYAAANEGFYELDGPKIVDTEYDAKKFADLDVVHDFIGYQIVNPTRYGEKLYLDGIHGTGDAGTEITTDKQIADALKAPADITTKSKKA